MFQVTVIQFIFRNPRLLKASPFYLSLFKQGENIEPSEKAFGPRLEMI